jgi:hypothetical protein
LLLAIREENSNAVGIGQVLLQGRLANASARLDAQLAADRQSAHFDLEAVHFELGLKLGPFWVVLPAMNNQLDGADGIVERRIVRANRRRRDCFVVVDSSRRRFYILE